MGTKFEASQSVGGAHHRLAGMAGAWEGTTTVWFAPGDPVDSSPQSGRIRLVGGGRWLLHEYEGPFEGKPQEGVAIYAVHLDAQACEIAWVDSFHTGTSILSSTAPIKGERFGALSSYADPQGGPPWGWRTQIDQPGDDELVITMTNITPQGEESKAVETRYRRISDRTPG